MPCPSCGNVLAPGLASCPRCLTFVPSNGTVAPGMVAPPQQALQNGYRPPPAPSPYVGQDSPLPTPYPHHYSYPPGMPPYYANAPAPRRELPLPLVIALVLVAFLLMFSGIGLIYYTAVVHPLQLRVQATATVQALLQGTTVANAQATGTAAVTTKVMGTAQAQATAQGQATASAYQNIYVQATSGAPAFSSSLASQDTGNWDAYDTNDGGGCSFINGALHSKVLSQDYYVPCFARNINVSNFAFQVGMTILKGDEGGVLFRANPTSNQYYFFMVTRDGTFSLYLSKDKQHNLSIAGDNSSAIKTNLGDTNLLTVIGKGSFIYLYINQQFAGSVNDTSFASGQLGVFASDHTNATEVAFKNARVWTL